ncbi:PA3496 family putative envelope integrity protein [Pseudomonas matsuisoli]|uniref:Uncharacterized protein n=1 Tax=Pseudomonas matsuisoli TaxID=1515666 RepID=A0A917PSU6_9PSED|nr:hypothetical protein [Pseudomonas matsuisoli]GGJ89634.1 hypothetical protein GCM10009304_14060 [Pseudomonas matsuisoli]
MSDLFASKPVARLDDERKARRKMEDQRRMAFRRAIESYAEQRQLQHELADYPDLVVANYQAVSNHGRYAGAAQR